LHIHRFSSILRPADVQALTGELKTLLETGSFPKRAWVNLWGVRSSHQYLLLPSAPDAELESMARHHGASSLGLSDHEVTVATSIGGSRGEPGHHPKREVSFFAAGSREIRAHLRPIVEAGFMVEGVTTPCGALWAQARLRRPSLPGEVHAHVALGVSQSALGIFSDGSLLYARDLDWGYADPSAGTTVPQHREVLAGHLATELRRSFLYLKQYWETDVSQVLLCGDMPEIRSLTAPLIERLNIEVETLDTLEGIDASALPEGFADRAATFRLASAVAAQPPPVNLLPVEITAIRTSITGERIVAAGTVAAVAFGAFLYGRESVREREAERLLTIAQHELASIRPGDDVANAAVTSPEVEASRRALLTSLDVQGPAMARVMEAVANAARPGIAVKSLRAVPDDGHWNVSVEATAVDRDPIVARRAASGFLEALEASPVLAEPIGVPTLRVVPDSGGVELSASYRVPR
jgi:Tfp pilus assembly PilM family ATPase